MDITRIVFWQNMASHHQAVVLANLAEKHDYQIIWVVEKAISEDRSTMGWPDYSKECTELVLSPNSKEINEILGCDPEHSLHFFGGIFFNPIVRCAFFRALFRPLRVALMTEPPLPAGFEEDRKSRLYSALKRFLPIVHRGVRLLFGKKIIAAFCIGAYGIEWYRAVGYPESKLIPWAYFPPAPKSLLREIKRDQIVNLVYLGTLNHRKGTDILFEALVPLKGMNWKLTCIGEGPLKPTCESIALEGGIDGQIEMVDFLPWEQAMAALALADLAVVPSRHDGWGAVVSESLMRGVPCIASSRCGSMDLLRHEWLGSVFPVNDIGKLSSDLQSRIEKGPISESDRKQIVNWSVNCQAEAGVSYFIAVLSFLEHGGKKPTAPWH